MNCEQARAALSARVDGEGDVSAVDAHLAACGPCAERAASLQRALAALKEHGPVPAPEGFERKVLARATADASTVPIPLDSLPAAPPRRRLRWFAWAGAAAAALVLAAVVQMFASLAGVLDEREGEIAKLRGMAEEARRGAPGPEPEPEPEPPAAPVPDRIQAEFIERNDLVLREGRYLPRELAERMERGESYHDGAWIAREEMQRRLQPPPAPPPLLPARPEEDIARDWLARQGLRAAPIVEEPAPAEPKPAAPAEADVVREFMARHGLVEHEGRVIPREELQRLAFERIIEAPEGATAPAEARRLLAGLRIGLPVLHEGLAIYPMSDDSARGPDLATLRDTEPGVVENGGLFAVQVSNPSDRPLFVPAGTLFGGGNFARVVRRDTVVPPRSAAKVRVYCAQPSMLSGARKLARGEFAAPASIRRRLQDPNGQAAVWTLVQRYAAALGVASKTPSIEDLYAAPAVRARIEALRGGVARFAAENPRARGAALAVGDQILLVQVFATPALLAAHLDQAVASAALDEALSRRGLMVAETQVPNAFHEVRRFVREAFTARYAPGPTSFAIGSAQDGPFGELALERPGGAPAALTLYAPAESEAGLELEALLEATASLPARKLERVLSDLSAEMARATPTERLQAVRELAAVGGSRGTQVLLGLSGSPDQAVARVALEALGRRRDPQAVAEIAGRLRNERDLEALPALADALSRFGDERAVEALTQRLSDPDPQVGAAVLPYIPQAIRGLRSRTAIERAMLDLIRFFEATFNAYWRPPETVAEDVRQRFRPAYAHALEALMALSGQEFKQGPDPRKWWNANKDAFVRGLLGQ
jgi:hypothetical protein